MTPDELLKKLFEIEENYGTYLAYRDRINIIQQAKEEWILEELIKAKNLTEHLSQEERNEYFDLRIKELGGIE